jgi:hypothetical protein
VTCSDLPHRRESGAGEFRCKGNFAVAGCVIK